MTFLLLLCCCVFQVCNSSLLSELFDNSEHCSVFEEPDVRRSVERILQAVKIIRKNDPEVAAEFESLIQEVTKHGNIEDVSDKLEELVKFSEIGNVLKDIWKIGNAVEESFLKSGFFLKNIWFIDLIFFAILFAGVLDFALLKRRYLFTVCVIILVSKSKYDHIIFRNHSNALEQQIKSTSSYVDHIYKYVLKHQGMVEMEYYISIMNRTKEYLEEHFLALNEFHFYVGKEEGYMDITDNGGTNKNKVGARLKTNEKNSGWNQLFSIELEDLGGNKNNWEIRIKNGKTNHYIELDNCEKLTVKMGDYEDGYNNQIWVLEKYEKNNNGYIFTNKECGCVLKGSNSKEEFISCSYPGNQFRHVWRKT